MSYKTQIAQFQKAMGLAARREGRERAREKAVQERVRAELEILMDEMMEEGLDPRTPEGMAFVIRLVSEKDKDFRAAFSEWESI